MKRVNRPTGATLSDNKLLYSIIGAAMIAVIVIGFGYMIGWYA